MGIISGTTHRVVQGRLTRWDASRAEHYYATGSWVRTTLVDALRQAAVDDPERIVVIDGAHTLSAAELLDRAEALARALLARASPGAVVSFMLPNWHEANVVYLAATLAGMIAHPILPSLRERELAFMLGDVGSAFVFIPDDFRGHDYATMLDRVCGGLRSPPAVFAVRGDGRRNAPFEALLEEAHDLVPPTIDPDAVRMILYTSGTTGDPKGVMHTHNSIHALVRQLGEHWRIDPGDSFLVPSPISHIGGSIYAFELPLLLGTCCILMDRWDANVALQTMCDHRVTHMAGATPFLTQLLAAAKPLGERLPALKLFVCGGASVPPALIYDAAQHFTAAAVTRCYGSTEVPVTVVGVIDRGDVTHAAETDGRAGIADVKLVPHPGARVGEGEIFARGSQMLVGYVHADDEDGLFDEEGYYRTGDLAHWRDGDFLVISGRAKDIIIRNGENISPKEIEDVLATHPDIAEVVIVGLPDPATGERACAVLVAAGTSLPTLRTIGDYLADAGIAAFKRPVQIAVWETLPKNPAGKIMKQTVRQRLLAATGES